MPRKKPVKKTERKKGPLYLTILGYGTRFVGAAAYLAVAGAIFALVYWRMGDLTGRYQTKAGDAEAALSSYEDSTLFVNLVRANLIVPRETDSGLDMAPPDYVLIKRASGKNNKDED